MIQKLGTITITVSCEVEGDVDEPTVAGPPTLALAIDLPLNPDASVSTTITYLRRVLSQLEDGQVAINVEDEEDEG